MSYYQLGQHDALTKLGMLSGHAGTVSYAPGKDDSNQRGNKKQDLWAEFDQEGFTTGEEKYGSDDYAASTSGPVATGGFDSNQTKSDRHQRSSSAMHESARALERYDESYGPEPGRTGALGSGKYAMSGVSSISASSALAPPPMPKINAGAPKPPKMPEIVGNAQHRLQNNVHDIDTSMSTGSVGRRMTGSAL